MYRDEIVDENESNCEKFFNRWKVIFNFLGGTKLQDEIFCKMRYVFLLYLILFRVEDILSRKYIGNKSCILLLIN